MPLADAADRLVSGQLTRRTIAITFDDGYMNNITNALPILERYGFPATIFLVSELVGLKTALWPNRILAAIANSERSHIDFRGHTMKMGNVKERIHASRKLQTLVKADSGDDPQAAVEEIERACGTCINPKFSADHDFAVMDASTIRASVAGGLIDFGAHSMTHPILSKVSDRRLKSEIQNSIKSVEELTGVPCRLFAYPNGGPDDFDDRAVGFLRETNVDYAVTTVQAQNKMASDSYRLSRWNVGGESSIAGFATKILCSGFISRISQ
ncbi:polysaccharide deacetylase family protein [Sulfitobacter sp. SK012]|uniref:polysaccharide deacetylase family protein n=1 Tax=Sulfitobacter sp. SK012 TaxID=1389005 RepID=UPI0026726ADE|nr:polysaccharide deacetylase family protein [Sulfitobacter sp. SK012]